MVETFRPGSNHVKSYIELSITLALMSFNFHIFINYFFPLQLMIGGLGKIDLDDWKKHTRLKHCTAESHIVRWFWRAVDNFDDEMRARLLQFVTGSSRVPLQGFKALQGTSTLGFPVFLGGGSISGPSFYGSTIYYSVQLWRFFMEIISTFLLLPELYIY